MNHYGQEWTILFDRTEISGHLSYTRHFSFALTVTVEYKFDCICIYNILEAQVSLYRSPDINKSS
jgi:hypothetical protein